MHRVVNEENFAAAIKDHCRINMLNNVRFNMAELLSNLKTLDPPDFVYNEHIFEKFEVDAYEKFETKKGKKASIEKRNVDKMQVRVNSPQNIFQTLAFRTPLEFSNTKHLKKNIEDMIEQKTKKLSKYAEAYPAGVFKSLIIEIVTRIEVFIDREGNFYDKKVDSHDLFEVKYQVYRDKNFISKIQDKYSNKWDVIVFVEKIYIKGEEFFILNCFDLKSRVENEKMLNYPETIFQIRYGRSNCIVSRQCNTTNITYGSDNLPSSVRSLEADKVKINDVTLYKHDIFDSVYVSDDGFFYFETSQLACAIDPDLQEEKPRLRLYVRYLVDNVLRLSCEGDEYVLNRKTPLSSFFASDNVNFYFKKDSKQVYIFKGNPFES